MMILDRLFKMLLKELSCLCFGRYLPLLLDSPPHKGLVGIFPNEDPSFVRDNHLLTELLDQVVLRSVLLCGFPDRVGFD